MSNRQGLKRGDRLALGTLGHIRSGLYVRPPLDDDLCAPACSPARADSTSTTFQPFFLNFHRVHALALHFFLRMWNESGASTHDFPRLVALTRSQYVPFRSSRLMGH